MQARQQTLEHDVLAESCQADSIVLRRLEPGLERCTERRGRAVLHVGSPSRAVSSRERHLAGSSASSRRLVVRPRRMAWRMARSVYSVQPPLRNRSATVRSTPVTGMPSTWRRCRWSINLSVKWTRTPGGVRSPRLARGRVT